MYTPDQVEAAAKLLRFDDPSSGDCTYAADILDAYAAALKAAQGGVTEAMVDGLMQLAREWCLSWGEWTHVENAAEARLRAALKAALSAEPAAQGEEESRQLREILAIYVAGPMLYTDDGELSDSTRAPYIDFLRDSADTIVRKLADRSRTAQTAQPAERVPEVTFDMMREAEHLCPSDLPHLDKLRWKASKITRALSARTPYFDGADSPERKWFVITGTNRADTPILLFTSRALAEQYCRQNPHPDGYSIYAAYPAPSERGKGDDRG